MGAYMYTQLERRFSRIFGFLSYVSLRAESDSQNSRFGPTVIYTGPPGLKYLNMYLHSIMSDHSRIVEPG